MDKRKIRDGIRLLWTFLLMVLIGFVSAGAGNNDKSWLKIYYESEGLKRIIANPLSEIDSVWYESEGEELLLKVASGWNDNAMEVNVDSIQSMVLGNNIPTLYIDTDPYVDEISSKEDYLEAKFRFIPCDESMDSVVAEVGIRGRGNSSWEHPKKPYRLKFDKKQSIGHLNKAKSFVLLSNYIDNTLMKNAVAFKIAELLGMPYTNKVIPVNLVFNGQFRGNYMLSNKVGINSGSVDIDEKKGILWELDTYFDEEFKFISSRYNLPCMVKDPDFHEIAKEDEAEIDRLWQYWQNDLESALEEVANGNLREVFDVEQLINYLIVQNIVGNKEVRYPKSLFIYKESEGEKYKFGPVWDFDYAFGYDGDVTEELFIIYRPIWKFMVRIFVDQRFLEKYKNKFNEFCEEKLDDLMAYIDWYADQCKDSAIQDAMRWPEEHYSFIETQERNTNQFEENVKFIKSWILERIRLIKEHENCMLW